MNSIIFKLTSPQASSLTLAQTDYHYSIFKKTGLQ